MFTRFELKEVAVINVGYEDEECVAILSEDHRLELWDQCGGTKFWTIYGVYPNGLSEGLIDCTCEVHARKLYKFSAICWKNPENMKKRLGKNSICRREYSCMTDYDDYMNSNDLTEDDRVLTHFEEQAIRSVHHEFQGLPSAIAAKKLGVSEATLRKALEQIKQKAPQLFPLLTPRQKFVLDLIIEEGLTQQQIADKLLISTCAVEKIIKTLRQKGVCLPSPPKIVALQPWHTGKKL